MKSDQGDNVCATTLQPYQQRVVEEKRELDERIAKLQAFMATKQFRELDFEQAHLMRLQHLHMLNLSHVLGKRIEIFERNAAQAPLVSDMKGAAGIDMSGATVEAPGTVAGCRKCGGRMAPGQALESTFTGSPDFPGGDVVTMSQGGPGRVIGCMKCESCGHSVGA